MQGSAQEKKKKMFFNPKNAQDFKKIIAEDIRHR